MTESERNSDVVLDLPANEDGTSSPPSRDDTASTNQPPKLPRRLRRRLLQSKTPITAEDIEAKLTQASLRRQVRLSVSLSRFGY